MAKVFISYASPNRDRAATLATFLEARSHSVFWDRRIPVGKSFYDVLETALREADAVLVLWSKAAVSSDWVKEEAEDAAGRGALVPVLVERVVLPLRFRHIQAADLTGSDGRALTSEVAELLHSIEALGSQAGPPPYPRPEFAPSPEPKAGHPPPAPAEGRHVPGRPSYGAALGVHVLFGFGLFHADPRLRRKWLYVLPPVYAVADALLGGRARVSWLAGDIGYYTFILAMSAFALSFVDVALVCRARRRAARGVASGARGDGPRRAPVRGCSNSPSRLVR